jgi:glycogen debranching enzyme
VDDREPPPTPRDIRDATVIKEGDLFLLTDLEGNVPRRNPDGFGLYLKDTRFVSAYELVVQGLKPTILLSSGRSHFLGAQVLTNPALVLGDGRVVGEQTVLIRRYRVVRPRAASESLTFHNTNPFAVRLVVTLFVEADFADIFDVRGVTPGPLVPAPPEWRGAMIAFERVGRDDVRRSTRVAFDPPPTAMCEGAVSYELDLGPREERRLSLLTTVRELPPVTTPGPTPVPAPLGSYRQWIRGRVGVTTDDAHFDRLFEEARCDLRLLSSGEPDAPFIAAGVPWYAALFGRDAILTAHQCLWEAPAHARHTLRQLARLQGTRDDPERDEEPGKILHELRRGELATAGLAPFSPYYGTVDATPLWILLLADHYRATAELELVRELRPSLEAALAWIDGDGDRDGDGFVEYACRSPRGLPNQGWKDSWNAIVHADGSLAEPPIALVEVQAYVVAAKRGAARLLRALGEPSRAASLDEAADRLARALDDAFWMPKEGTYCLALDGRKRQVASITSNPGHVLWCGAAPPERAALVARRLLAEDLFSGWGVRTLATHEPAYNPTGYHLGTVWPHDNALFALGLKRYGDEASVLAIVTGMYDAAQTFPGGRMPELFCGFDRSAFGTPVRYPVACCPQAWAATAWSAFLRALLGLCPDAPARELCVVRPRLPPWLRTVEVSRVPVGGAEVDLVFQRTGEHTAVDVTAMRGDVRVALVDRWEEG